MEARPQYNRTNNVYVDSFALAEVEGYADTEHHGKYKTGSAVKTVRGRLTAGNENWADYYRYAMTTAHTMVFSFTRAWFNSPWCGRELNYFIKENAFRVKRGLQPLKGIGLAFKYDIDMSQVPSIGTMVEVKKKFKFDDPHERWGGNPLIRLADDELKQRSDVDTQAFTLDDDDLKKVLEHIT